VKVAYYQLVQTNLTSSGVRDQSTTTCLVLLQLSHGHIVTILVRTLDGNVFVKLAEKFFAVVAKEHYD